MVSYIAKRVLSLLPVLLVVSVVIFLITYLMPGGPATILLGMDATQAEIDALNEALGLNRPFLVQYLEWLGNVLRGDWGESLFLRQSVLSAIGEHFMPTLSLALLAQLFSLVLAIPLGILSAYRRGTAVDLTLVSVSLLGIAVPGFLLGMFFMLFFGVFLKWLPVAGYAALSTGWWNHLRYLLLPALSLSVVQAAYITRMTRSSVVDTLYHGYIRTARAKGLGEGAVVLRHALKNAAPTILTVVGQSFGGLVTGTIVTETLFNIPGLGRLTINAINRRDIFVIQGVVLFVTLLYVAVNLIVDILYGVVDPRIQIDKS